MFNPFVAGEHLTADRLNGQFPQLAFQAVDSAPVNNSTTLVSSTYLVLPVVANATYYVELLILSTVATAADFKNNLTLPSGTGLIVPFGSDTAVAAATTTVTLDSTTTLTWATGGRGTGTPHASNPKGFLDIDTTAGNVTFRFAQQTANLSNAVLKAGSVMMLTRVA